VAELVKEIWIDAAPEKVFPYLVEPDLLTTWIGEESWNEPRPGGAFRLSFGQTVVSGEFVELDPPRRAVWTWGHEHGGHEGSDLPPGSTTVAFDLEPENGGTRVRLRHSNLPTEHEVEQHTKGWDHFLPLLAKVAA
jgi:uncharacterized protein YndB with AHSA1/START domain